MKQSFIIEPVLDTADMMIIDTENDNYTDHDNDDQIQLFRYEFEQLQQQFSSIKKHYSRILNDMIDMEKLFDQFELQSHQFRRKFLKNWPQIKKHDHRFHTNNNDDVINTLNVNPKCSNQSVINLNIDCRQSIHDQIMNNIKQQQLKSNSYIDEEMNVDHQCEQKKNYPKINELNVNNVDSLSLNTIDHLIDSLCKDAIIDPRVINENGNYLFNSIIDDNENIEQQQQQQHVSDDNGFIPEFQQLIQETITDDDDDDESMKTAEEFRSSDELILESPRLDYHTPFDSLSDVQELLSDESGCAEVLDYDPTSDENSDTTLTASPSNEIESSDNIGCLNSKKSVSFEIEDSAIISEKHEMENENICNINVNDNNNNDDGNEFPNELRIDIGRDQNDNKSFEFFIRDQDGQPIRERIILKPIPKSSEQNNEYTVNTKKNKYCNDDDDDYDYGDFSFNNNNLIKPRSPSLDHDGSSQSSSIDEQNYDWRTMRNFWERRSLGPHYRFGQKKFKK